MEEESSQLNFANDTQCETPYIEKIIRARKKSINNRELLFAAYENKVKRAKYCVETNKGEVNFQDKDGNTALHYGIIKGNEEVVEYLIEHDANINIENINNENSLDVAINYKQEKIIKILGIKIVDDSLSIIKKINLEKTKLPDEPCIPSDNKCDTYEYEERKLRKRIEVLLNRLQALPESDSPLSYEQANIFILFIETFAIQGSGDENIRKTLRDGIMKEKDNKIICDTRNFILKSRTRFIRLQDIETVIKYCFKVNDKKEFRVHQFFNTLKEYLQCIKQNNNIQKRNISDFFAKCPALKRQDIGIDVNANITNRDSVIENEFKNLLLEAYTKGNNLEQLWFNFIVNIYPLLDPGKEKCNLNKELVDLRNQLVHEFYQYNIYYFREAIINLRGELFKSYYIKKVYKTFDSITFSEDIEDIKKNLNKDLEDLQDYFKDLRKLLSEEEANKLFGYKLEKLLFPKQTLNSAGSDLKSMVEDYFKFMSVIEDVNRTDQDNNYRDYERNENEKIKKIKKLEDAEKRKIFENFVRLKSIKENFESTELYKEEQEKIITNLSHYEIDKTKVTEVCKYYLEESKNFNKEMYKIIEYIVRFIESNIKIQKNDEDSNKSERFFTTLIANEDAMNDELTRVTNKKDNDKRKQEIDKIKQLYNQLDSYGNKPLSINDVILEINIKQTVQNMFRIFYNGYHEYKIEFNIEDIFCRESFLEELVPYIENKMNDNIAVLIFKLIQIEYLSPYIVKLIKKQSDRGKVTDIIDKNSLLKLIDNLLRKEEYASYLNILLGVEIEKFNPYEKMYYSMLDNIDFKNIRSIFKDFEHLEKFADLLTLKNCKNEEKKSIIELTKQFFRIINEEVADRLNAREYDKALEILEKGKEIQNRFEEDIECSNPDYIDMDILESRIKIETRECEEALTILEKSKDKIKSSFSDICKAKCLLILSEIAYAKKVQRRYCNSVTSYSEVVQYGTLYSEIIKYVTGLEDISMKLNILQKVKEKYNEIKSNDRYKNLLASSKLLCAEKCLDILRIAADAAFEFIKSNDCVLNGLKIYEEIYSCYKKDFGIDNKYSIRVIRFIANTYSDRGEKCKKNFDLEGALHNYLNALIRYNIIYNTQVKIFGPQYAFKILGNRITHCLFHTLFINRELRKLSDIDDEEHLAHVYKEKEIYEELEKFHKINQSEKYKLDSVKDQLNSINRYINRMPITCNNKKNCNKMTNRFVSNGKHSKTILKRSK